jgi:hypothetical protein
VAQTIEIAELVSVKTDHLDEARVREYAEQLDEMPPVVVFETPHGLLMADGYHRVAAARLLGRTEIVADVQQGTNPDAFNFAVQQAVDSGLSREAAIAAIKNRRPD